MILHHFAASPFSEKIRAIFGYKQLTWQSVEIPRILPKPDLMPLTGGYRRTPVLQIGRDVFADTRLIARIIDEQQPERPLCPAAQAASVAALESWADQSLFLAAIPVLFRPAGRAALEAQLGADYLARFQADRAELFAGGAVGRPDDQFSRAIYEPTLALMNAQLANQPFMLGDAPTLADFALYNPVWYVRQNQGMAPLLDDYPQVLVWADRLKALGHGQPEDLSSTQALQIAREAADFVPLAGTIDPACGCSAGDIVAVAARDYGVDRVTGALRHMDNSRVVIERDVESLGRIRNHFPRQGFEVSAA